MLKRFFFYIKMHIGKSHYRKMLLSYSIFTFIIITVISLTMINFYNRNLSEEIAKSDKRLLKQVKISSDILIGYNVQSLIMDKFLDVSRDINILNFFYAGSSNETETIYLLYNSLSNIMVDNSFIDSIYIYRKRDDTLISSREGVIFSVSSHSNKDKNYVNIDAVLKTMSSSKNQYWISPLENQEYWKNRKIISFAQSIPYFKNSEKIGCVMININEEMFFKAINNASDTGSGQLAVIDSQGRVFTHSKPLELFKKQGNIDYPKEVYLKNEGFATYQVEGKMLGISWIKSSLNDWRYVSITPISTLNNELFIAKQFAIMIMVLAILFSLIFIKFITSYLYRPFKQFLKTLKVKLPAPQEGESTDDLTAINRLITNLSDKVEEMDEILQQNQGLIEHKIVMDIIYGRNVSNRNDINERLKILHESFAHTNFAIIMTEIDNHELKRLKLEQHEYVIYKVINTIDEIISQGCICLSASVQSNRIATVVNYENNDNFDVRLPFLLSALRFDPGINCNIVVSSPVNDILLLSGIYEEACNYMKYGFIYNYGNIFTSEQIKLLEKNGCCFDIGILDDTVPLFRSQKTAVLKEEISKIHKLLKSGSYSCNDVQNVLLQLINLFCKIVKEQNINVQTLDRNKILTDFSCIFSLDEYMQWFLGLIDTYIENIHIRDSSIDIDFINKVMDYITDNIDKQISLNSIAEKFCISPNYLSRIFKEKIGTNISDFVIDKKLQKAKELIVSERNKNISEIGQQLGYFNTPYFISIFKEKYGITPSKLRKRSLTDTCSDV